MCAYTHTQQHLCRGVAAAPRERVRNVGEVIGEAAANVIRIFDDSILAQPVMRMYSSAYKATMTATATTQITTTAAMAKATATWLTRSRAQTKNT